MITPPVRHPVYAVLHRPMLLFGIDAVLVGVSVLVSFVVMFVTVWFPSMLVALFFSLAAARVLTRRDPQTVDVWLVAHQRAHRRGWRRYTRFDPLTHDPVHSSRR